MGIAHRINTSIGEFVIQGKLRTRTTAEFEEAMEQIRAYFMQTEKQIYIPMPNEVNLEDYSDNFNREGM